MSSFRRRLALAGILTAAVALIIVLLVQGRVMSADTRSETRERLRAEAQILAHSVCSGPFSAPAARATLASPPRRPPVSGAPVED